jgi:hypothetical protein
VRRTLATDCGLDLNAGLTQVLEDGTNTYYYGVDRIAQKHGGQYDYFLGMLAGRGTFKDNRQNGKH